MEKPVAILLHGGGLSDWSLVPLKNHLTTYFEVVTPVIAGHGSNFNNTFSSIENSAKELIQLINDKYGGTVDLLYGLSLGAQIVCECIALSPSSAKHAVIESARVIPNKIEEKLAVPTYRLSYSLLKSKRFSTAQAKALCLPPDMFDDYYKDICRMTMQSLINITKSNSSYSLPKGISQTKAKILIVYGDKEIRCIKQSANLLQKTLPNNQLYVANGCKHGEVSLLHSDSYAVEILNFLQT